MHDAIRVSKGLKKIAEIAIRRNGPELKLLVQSAVQHGEDLIANIYNSQKSQAGSSSQHDKSSVSSPTTPEKEEDLIGFESIPDTSSSTIKVENSSFTQMREQSVPSTQFGRLAGFGSLAFRMAVGEMYHRASATITGDDVSFSEANADRLAEALCRMRGAALKLGQMLSLQDDASLPPSLRKALERVKHAADYMPKAQLEKQLVAELGPDWRSKFLVFDEKPIAAASIGQVHKAKLPDGTDVAVKIQYPGVAESINSDLQNLKRLISVANFLPPGLFLDNIIKVASVELTEECDYGLEAASQTKYRDLVLNDKVLRRHSYVPEVFPQLSTKKVLTSKLVAGVSIDFAVNYPQAVRNAIARTALILTIRELFEWRFIQSDPNFANFLYDHPNKTINLIDFGAAREYQKSFVDGYMRLVWAAANKDRQKIYDVSKELGFLTGDESKEFVDAHIEAGLVVGEPFVSNETFDFGNSQLTTRIGQYGGTFMKHRLTPPPTEAYSLHRKLAGAFLLCIKLQAKIPCRDILESTFNNYKFDQ